MVSIDLKDRLSNQEAVLGALLLEPAYLPDVRSLLTGETFADPTNRRIYETILSLDDRGKSVDLASIASALRTSTGKEPQVSVAYLVGLSNDVGTGVNCVSWASQLKDTETRRRLEVFSYELATRAATDPDGVYDWAMKELSMIGDRSTSTNDLRPLGAILRESLQQLESRCRAYASGQPVGTSTGLRSLDTYTGGWHTPSALARCAGLTGCASSRTTRRLTGFGMAGGGPARWVMPQATASIPARTSAHWATRGLSQRMTANWHPPSARLQTMARSASMCSDTKGATAAWTNCRPPCWT